MTNETREQRRQRFIAETETGIAELDRTTDDIRKTLEEFIQRLKRDDDPSAALAA